MPRKYVDITMLTRNPEDTSEIIGQTSSNGYTDDDGATLIIGVGYLPGIENCQPGDLRLAINTITEKFPNVTGRTVDEENSVQIISLADPS